MEPTPRLFESVTAYTAKHAESILSNIMDRYPWYTTLTNLRRGVPTRGWRLAKMGYPKGVKRCGVRYDTLKTFSDKEGNAYDQEIVVNRCRFAVPCKVHEGTGTTAEGSPVVSEGNPSTESPAA